MPSYQFVIDFLLENFENVKIRNDRIVARCALCGDSAKSNRKARFNLKYDDKNTIFHCFNCGESGNFYKLYSLIKKVDVNQAYSECESIGRVFDGFSDAIFCKRGPKKEVVLPSGTNFNWILSECFNEYNYETGIINEALVEALKDFRSTRKIPSQIHLFIAYKGNFAGRIIIPVFDVNGDVEYFQGRSVTKSVQPKYLNPSSPKEIIIPNFDFFDGIDPVVIVEGLLDLYSINNKNVTCCLGKEIDDEFIKRIRTRTKSIIIALDNDRDGRKSTINIIKNSLYGGRMKYFIMPHNNIKDINELLVYMDNKNINMYRFILENSHKYTKYLQRMKGE